MSYRSSFTSEYIYNENDYIKIRSLFDNNRNKYLCTSPPPYWRSKEETFYMPIISGKIGGLYSGEEVIDLVSLLTDILTEEPVRFVIMQETGEIVLLTKQPDGEVIDTLLKEVEDSEDE